MCPRELHLWLTEHTALEQDTAEVSLGLAELLIARSIGEVQASVSLCALRRLRSDK